MNAGRSRRGIVFFVAGILLVGGAFGISWALAPDTDRTGGTTADDGGDLGYDTVLVGVQGPGPRGNVTEIDANGTTLWTYDGGTGGTTISYQDVSRLDDGRVLATFADDGYEDCGSYDSPCFRTGVRFIDPGPEPTVTSEWSYAIRTRQDSEVHDAELMPDGELLVADMEWESIFTIDPSTGERTWTWNASEHYDAPDDPTREDWLHINDVDRIDDGRYLVSVRNENQLVIVERGEGVVEVINEDGDRDVLYEQHNPQWLGDGHVLVADSENHRVVELERNESTGAWETGWSVYEVGGIAFDWPRDADRLPNGNTMITDSRNNRVVVVGPDGNLVRSYSTPPLPYEADPTPHGELVAPSDPATRVDGSGQSSKVPRIPVLSTALAGLRHVVPLPHWVAEWHLVAVALGVLLWTRGAIDVLRRSS